MPRSIIVKYVGVFSMLTGKQVEEVPFRECLTLYELLTLLSAKYGKAFYDEIFEGNKIRTSLLLLVNGARVEPTFAENLKLKVEDSIIISPLLAMGG